MQNKVGRNKENCTVFAHKLGRAAANRVKKPTSIKELLNGGGRRISGLTAKVQARSKAFEHVYAALPSPLAQKIVSAGFEEGQLTIGVAGGTWATRLRYVTETLRVRVGLSMRVDIQTVRIKVVPPRA